MFTEGDDIHSMPMEAIADTIAGIDSAISAVNTGAKPAGVGVGFPGIIRNGIIEESPNLKQAKGARLADAAHSRFGRASACPFRSLFTTMRT